MKIAYLSASYPPYPGGIGVAAQYLAREMVRNGHEATVFTPQYKGAETASVVDGVNIHYLKPVFQYGNAGFLPQLKKLLRGFDVVHCYYPFFGGLEVAAYAKSRGAKFALVVHHEMDTHGEGFLKRVFKAHEIYLMPWVLRQTDTFAVLSQDYFDHSPFAQMLKKKNRPACNATCPKLLHRCRRVRSIAGRPRVAIIPNGVDVELFKPTTKHASCHEIPRLILVAGLDRAHYFKGVPVLISAIRLLKDRGISVVATIVGEGDMCKEYEQFARDESVNDRIEFAGLVTHDKLPALLNGQDIFIMPSVAPTESFCIAAAEAQACGLPAIVSDLPGLRQTIGVGETGFSFPVGSITGLADAITKFIEDKEMYERFSVAARARMVERFSWQQVAKMALDTYEQALHHPQKS